MRCRAAAQIRVQRQPHRRLPRQRSRSRSPAEARKESPQYGHPAVRSVVTVPMCCGHRLAGARISSSKPSRRPRRVIRPAAGARCRARVRRAAPQLSTLVGHPEHMSAPRPTRHARSGVDRVCTASRPRRPARDSPTVRDHVGARSTAYETPRPCRDSTSVPRMAGLQRGRCRTPLPLPPRARDACDRLRADRR